MYYVSCVLYVPATRHVLRRAIEFYLQAWFSPVEISSTGIVGIPWHSVKKILNEVERIGIETFLARLSSQWISLDFKMTFVVGGFKNVECNCIARVVGCLRNTWHWVSLCIQPQVVIIIGPTLIHTANIIVSIYTLWCGLIKRDSGFVIGIAGYTLTIRINVTVTRKQEERKRECSREIGCPWILQTHTHTHTHTHAHKVYLKLEWTYRAIGISMYPWPWTVGGRAVRAAKMAEDRIKEDRKNFIVFLFVFRSSF